MDGNVEDTVFLEAVIEAEVGRNVPILADITMAVEGLVEVFLVFESVVEAVGVSEAE
jgi:hypothetical protein